jgi:hypothetical protein
LGLAMLLEKRSDGVDEDKNPSAIEQDKVDAFQ